MDIAEERESLKEEINRLKDGLRAIPAGAQWDSILDEVRCLRSRLERSYISRPRWWLRRLGRSTTCITYRFRSFDVETRPIEPFGASSLPAGFSEKVWASSLERIDVTADNLSDWLDDQIRQTPGFDAARCFRALNAAVYTSFCEVCTARGRYFLEATNRDRILISGIVRWPFEEELHRYPAVDSPFPIGL